MYKKAQAHFKKVDQKLYKASLLCEIEDSIKSDDLYRDIIWTIIGQQLSGKAADTIFGRFKKLFPGETFTPELVKKLRETKMRGVGLSGAKTRAVQDLTEKVLKGELDLNKLPFLKDEEVVAELIKVKGIGPWTAEMILMFSLGRTDIFSTGDLALRKGIMKIYNLKKFPNEKKLKKIIEAWSPYRTYAAKILWKIIDEKGLARTTEIREGK